MRKQIGYLDLLTGTILFYIPIYGMFFLYSQEVISNPKLLFFLIGPPFIYFGVHLTKRGLKKLQDDANDKLESDSRAPVLYLRSFSNDGHTINTPRPNELFFLPHLRAEEFLYSFNRLGPLIAIGKPGEPLPNLGAFKMYIQNSEWKTKVIETMRKSVITVMMLGNLTSGFTWELVQAKELLMPSQLYLFFPFTDKYRKDKYHNYKQYLEKVFNCRFPSYLDKAYFIRFTNEWQPVWVADSKSNPTIAIQNCIKRIFIYVNPSMKYQQDEFLNNISNEQLVLICVHLFNGIILLGWAFSEIIALSTRI